MVDTIDFEYDEYLAEGDDFNSSVFNSILYNNADEQLLVEFKSGADFLYNDVKRSTFNLFTQAPSLGAFYNAHISGKFPSEQVDALVSPTVERVEAEDERISQLVSQDETDTPFVPDPTLFGVKWVSDNFPAAGPFEFTTLAVDEESAIQTFWDQYHSDTSRNTLGLDSPHVVAVTHYFSN